MIHKIFYYIFISTIILGCSEGDIIDNSVNNFDAPLVNCFNESKNTFVFYKIDNIFKFQVDTYLPRFLLFL